MLEPICHLQPDECIVLFFLKLFEINVKPSGAFQGECECVVILFNWSYTISLTGCYPSLPTALTDAIAYFNMQVRLLEYEVKSFFIKVIPFLSVP